MTELELPPVIGERYRPIRLIGRGGMGSVYLVHHVHTEEAWALKVLMTSGPVRDDLFMRFKREARALARIRSDHVVRVIDADTAPELNNAPYYVMEFLEGVDLESVTAGAPQPARLVVEWLRQASRGLERAHAAGIVHRDLKPENLFLTRYEDNSPLIKVLDFGIAKVIGEGASKTQTGAVLGTPLYMAYEQANGDASSISPATDVWAIGMIAYRLLTGQNYWGGEAISRVLAEIIYVPVSPPSQRGCDFGPAFDAWFLRSCDRDPRRRWPSVREQADGLADALRNVTGVSLNSIRAASTAMPVAPDVRFPADRADTTSPDLSNSDNVGPSLTASVSDVLPRFHARPLPPSPRRRYAQVAAVLVGVATVASTGTYFAIVKFFPNDPGLDLGGAASSAVVPPMPSPPATSASVPLQPPTPSATQSATPDAAPDDPSDASGRTGSSALPRPPGVKLKPPGSTGPRKPPSKDDGNAAGDPDFNERQ
jgi:eukaryotic-like serine/threonine-protein kinase